jgi:predicted phage terminase large subunit-like protein
LVIVDDLESEETVWQEMNRKKLADWFWRSLINTMSPDAQLIMIGTILHPDSLLSTIQKKPPPGWRSETYKAIKDDGSSLWPSRWSLEYLNNRRDEIGAAAFEQEYQNNPVPDEWRTFHEEDFRYFDVPPDGCAYFTTVDPAIQVDTKRDPDYTAIVTCACDADKNIYVVDVTRKRMLPDETIQEVFRHWDDYHPQAIGIETVGFQKMLKFALEEEADRRQEYPYFKEMTTGGVRKRFRIERLQPYFKRGKIFMRDFMHELKAELLSFPTGKHDDMIDALATQLELIQRGDGSAKQGLPHDSFEAWWTRHKTKQRRARMGESTWGNHKLRRV